MRPLTWPSSATGRASTIYKKARRGARKNLTGIDSPYEPPERAEIRINTTAMAPEDAAHVILAHLRGTGNHDLPRPAEKSPYGAPTQC